MQHQTKPPCTFKYVHAAYLLNKIITNKLTEYGQLRMHNFVAKSQTDFAIQSG